MKPNETNPIPAEECPETMGRWLLYEATQASMLTLLTLGFSYRWEGQKNVPRQGPVLLAANHQSFLDPPMVGAVVPRHLVFLARKTLFRHPLVNILFRSLNGVPIDQEGVGKEGLKTTLEQLRMGKAVLVFPEGTRSSDGLIHEMMPGIHLLMKKTHVPIVPIGVAGAYDAWPSWRKYPHFSPLWFPPNERTIALSIGKPLPPSAYAGMSRLEALTLLAEQIAACQQRAELLRRKGK